MPTVVAAFNPPVATGVTADFTAAGSATAARQAFSVGLFPGDVVADRYEILAHVGDGGMGSVYKALDRELDRVVALKTIRPDLASNATILRRFKQEILLARKITHQNVIRTYDLGVAGALRFLTMEFFEGEDLCAYLERRGSLPPNEAVAIMSQICEGLQAAHEEGVIHRDLKPQNILINSQEQVRILDFGLARDFEVPGVTHAGLAVGTPDYMSPEQARGEEASARSDIYSIGLIFYELLIGGLPFKGETAMSRLVQRTIQSPPSPKSIKDEIPQHLDNIVMRCLEIDPEWRYESADALLADLRNWEQPQAPAVPHSSSEVPVIPAEIAKSRWSKKLVALTATAIVVCGILIGYLYLHSKGAAPSPNSIAHSTNPEALELVNEGRDKLKHRQDPQQVQAALELFNQAATKDPNSALPWAGMVDANLAMYRLDHKSIWTDNAQTYALEAKKRDADAPETHLALGSVYTQTGNLSEAIKEIQQALKIQESDDGYVRLGRAYLANKNVDAAIKALETAVHLKPFNWYNQDQLARAYWKKNRLADALKHFQEAADRNPTNADLFNSMGVIYSGQGQWPKAIEAYQKAISLQKSAEAYSNLGTAYFYAGQYSKAVPMLQKAVEMDPHRAAFVGNLADAYREAKQYEKAQTLYDQAIELAYERLQINGKDADTMGNLALYYAKKGGRSKGLELITSARSLDPKNIQLLYNEAVIQALNKNSDAALKSLAECLKSGFPKGVIMNEPDLASLRATPEFAALMRSNQ
ncbi:MAG: tetratricopeptide repeat protein [Acidobacteriaceae bacterium]|nr:tetratricopeptide repeat protein [Acidobacteriaceae bacterium]MBV9304524.1 tetratricopeptide repeat protein [Acidobacteriaceae bacterium]